MLLRKSLFLSSTAAAPQARKTKNRRLRRRNDGGGAAAASTSALTKDANILWVATEVLDFALHPPQGLPYACACARRHACRRCDSKYEQKKPNNNNNNNNNHFTHGPPRIPPTGSSSQRGLLPPNSGGELMLRRVPCSPHTQLSRPTSQGHHILESQTTENTTRDSTARH